MKSLLLILSFMGVASVSASAAPSSTAGSAGKAPAPGKARAAKGGTQVKFEDALVEGKYHFSDEEITTVEDDKVIDTLLSVRTDFKDRLKKSATRQ